MLDSVLRVFGEDFDVKSFLQHNKLTVPVDSYNIGEPDILGSPNSDSGFDALLSENGNIVEHLNELRLFLKNNSNIFSILKKTGASCIIDLSSSVASDDPFTQSIHLPVDFLGLCFELNISIEISNYPSGDNE